MFSDAQEAWRAAHRRHAVQREIMVDDAILRAEIENVFQPSWLFIGFESEIPDPGDYVVRTMADDGVILVRSERGEVNVLLNSCTHRGTRLCEATFGNSAHFRCGYHGWTFANDGRLVGVPGVRAQYPPGFDKAALGLHRPRVETYRGFVFATWNDEGPSLRDYLGDFRWYLDAMLDIAPGEWEVYAPPQRVRVTGNWKIKQENLAGDGYHLQTTHAVAFGQGVFPREPGTRTHGYAVSLDGGHAVRLGYSGEPGGPIERSYEGIPEELWPGIAERLTDEQARLHSRCSYMHGVVFPNAAFLTNSQSQTVADPGDPVARFLVWRLHTPISAHETEVTYWALVPKDFPEGWKRVSYKMQVRVQSAGGLFFEHDDFENFARIDAASRGHIARKAPMDFTLGLDHRPDLDGFPGPGRVQHMSASEQNQRAFYRHWQTLMAGDGR